MPIIFAVTGGSGSGKGTLCNELLRIFGDNAVYLSTDFYYKGRDPETSMDEYFQRNFDHPDAILLERFVYDVIRLYNGIDIKHPIMDFSGGTFIRTDDAVELNAKPIIVIDGIFSLEDRRIQNLVKENGYSIFTWAPSAVAQKRVAIRDAKERHNTHEHTLNVYTNSVMTGYYSFIKPHKRTSDLLLRTWNVEEKDIDVQKLSQQVLSGILSKFPKEVIAERIPEAIVADVWKDMTSANTFTA